MAAEIKTWQIIDGRLIPIQSSLSEEGRKEKDDLEKWIKSNPAIISDDIAIIGEQVPTASGPLDFLGIDSSGNTVIIELKRDKLPREALVQAIDYASDVSNWDIETFEKICESYTNESFEVFFQKHFEEIALEDLAINQAQRLLLIGFSVEDSLGRMIEWLSDKYSIAINAILLNYVKTQMGDEILSRTAIIPEEVEKQKANKQKFIIAMSNEPGSYDIETLEKKLIEYLSNNLWSSRRLRDYFLPTLLKKGQVTRSELKKEFVKLGAADSESMAGYFLSLISSQLGYKRNDFLRQVIYYGYPNHSWEKDDFKLQEEYKELITRILSRLKVENES